MKSTSCIYTRTGQVRCKMLARIPPNAPVALETIKGAKQRLLWDKLLFRRSSLGSRKGHVHTRTGVGMGPYRDKKSSFVDFRVQGAPL